MNATVAVTPCSVVGCSAPPVVALTADFATVYACAGHRVWMTSGFTPEAVVTWIGAAP